MSEWGRFEEFIDFLKDSKIAIFLKRKLTDTVILPVVT